MMAPHEVPNDASGHTSAHGMKRELYIDGCRNNGDEIFAHEMGHALRLRHLRGKGDPGNLMHSKSVGGWHLRESQIRKAKRTWYLWFGRVAR